MAAGARARMLLRVASTIALLGLAVFGAALPAQSSAATTIRSIPGAVEVEGDSADNKYVVRESHLDLNTSDILLQGFAASVAELQTAEQAVRMRAEAFAPRAIQPGHAEMLNSRLLRSLNYLLLVLQVKGDNRSDVNRVLTITDWSPTTTVARWPCRLVDVSTAEQGREQVPAGQVNRARTVACPMIPLDSSGPVLDAHTGAGDDELWLNLKCELCLSQRLVFGGSGDDLLLGSGFRDVMAGEAGDDKLFGEGGDDELWGYEAYASQRPENAPVIDDDRLDGGDGNDTLFGQYGRDIVDGGGDADVGRPLYLIPEGPPGLPALDPQYSGAAVQGGPDGDVVLGGGGEDTISGDAGGDTLLTRESDLGLPDWIDRSVDCAGGGPLFGGHEYYRVTDLLGRRDPLFNCTHEIPHRVSALDLDAVALDQTAPWPWEVP